MWKIDNVTDDRRIGIYFGGELLIDGERMNEVESCNRNIAMVFQSYALYPHMTVFENIAYSMKLKKVPKKRSKNGYTR